MNTRLLNGLLVIWCLLGATQALSQISVSIAVPKKYDVRTIDYLDPASHFHVIVSNISDMPQRIWQEWCSWGYYGLSFEFTDENGKKWVAAKKPRSWRRNFRDWWTLDPHESLVIDVHFGDLEVWDGFPKPEDASRIVTMQAVFEFKPDDESRKNGIWTGRVVSTAEKFTFHYLKPQRK